MTLRDLVKRGGKRFLGDEITELKSEIIQRRFQQALITGMAISMPVLAMTGVTQKKEMRILALYMGGIFGAASALVAKHREEIESRGAAYIQANRESAKNQIKNIAVVDAFTEDLTRDHNTVQLLASSVPAPAALAYGDRLGIPRGMFADALGLSIEAGEQSPPSSPPLLFQNGVADPNQNVVDTIIDPTARAVLDDLARQYPKIIRLDGGWVDELIVSSCNPNLSQRQNHHIAIFAKTQAGKSTLAGYIANGIAKLSRVPAIIAGHDPKKDPHGADLSTWLCQFTKGYKIDGYVNASKWCQLSKRLCQDQINLASDIPADKRGELMPELVMIQDEVNTCYGEGHGYGRDITKDDAKDLQAQWKFICTNMAGVYSHGIFMGQSPLKSDTGFSGTAMDNTCFIAMSGSAEYIMDPKNIGNYLRNIPAELLEVLQRAIAVCSDAGLRYALVRPTLGLPYVGIVPKFDTSAILNRHQAPPQDQIDTSIVDPTPASTPTPPPPPSPTPVAEPSSRDDEIRMLYTAIKHWVDECKAGGLIIDRETIREKWFQETGVNLSDSALHYLLEKLGMGDS